MSTTTTEAGVTASVSHARPLTGAEYLESIDDGRQIFIYGERVEKTSVHPAFRNSARLYDALHDPEQRGQYLVATDTGSGGQTHAYFRAPTNAAEALAGRDAIAAWRRLTYGWLGRGLHGGDSPLRPVRRHGLGRGRAHEGLRRTLHGRIRPRRLDQPHRSR
jgi:hypothetical protein